jgi:DNA polymerase-1
MLIWKKISELYAKEGILKIFHNLMFDFLQLAGRGIYVAPPYYDTMVAHNRAYLDLTKKKLKKLRMNSLAFCTALYTEEVFYKDDHKDENRGDNWRGADREFWIYNAKDSAVLHEIKAATMRDLTEMGTWHLYEVDMDGVFKALASMGLQGVLRDVGKVEELNKFVSGRIELLQDELDKTVGHPLNTKSSPQMQKFLYSELGLPIQFNKDTGRPTADEGAIAKLYQKTKNPILRTITNLTRLRTFKQNYLDAVVGEDGRTRTTYNQAKTSTVRISSSDAILGSGKNLQVIPAYPRPGEDDYNRLIVEFKDTFIADPGMLMWKRDYRQAEAMVVAWLAEDLQQINDFQSGVDIHCRTLEILYDIPYDRAVEECKTKNPEWVMRRNLGKRVKHGANYKLGAHELHTQCAKQGLDIEVKECRRMLQAIASNLPSITRWHAEVIALLRDTRTITNRFGRKRRFLGIIDDDAIREAIAFDPQSTVGDLLNFALARIYHTPSLISEMDLLLQLHDAAIGQSPCDKLKEHTEIVGELMSIPLMIKGRELIIPTDLEVGPSWGSLSKPPWWGGGQ